MDVYSMMGLGQTKTIGQKTHIALHNGKEWNLQVLFFYQLQDVESEHLSMMLTNMVLIGLPLYISTQLHKQVILPSIFCLEETMSVGVHIMHMIGISRPTTEHMAVLFVWHEIL